MQSTSASHKHSERDEIGRILTWGTHPARHGDYELASPSLNCDIPQTYLEPILVKNATMRGTQTQFSTEYLSYTQDEDGVSVRVLNRLTGTEYTIRTNYLIGADGSKSKVAADINLPMEGQMDIAGSMNNTFKTDLSKLVDHCASVLYCAGDAVHKHPPSNGLGSNTSIQDSYNLAWKIASVLNQQASPTLLDTYTTERAITRFFRELDIAPSSLNMVSTMS